MLVGSPDYMAPERVSGRPQGPPSDVWSLGATLCAALGGRSPFSRDTTLATLHAVLYEEPQLPPVAGPLRDILSALLEKDPSTRAGLDTLEASLRPSRFPRPPPRWWWEDRGKGARRGLGRGARKSAKRDAKRGAKRGVRKGAKRGVRKGAKRSTRRGLGRGLRRGARRGPRRESSSKRRGTGGKGGPRGPRGPSWSRRRLIPEPAPPPEPPPPHPPAQPLEPPPPHPPARSPKPARTPSPCRRVNCPAPPFRPSLPVVVGAVSAWAPPWGWSPRARSSRSCSRRPPARPRAPGREPRHRSPHRPPRRPRSPRTPPRATAPHTWYQPDVETPALQTYAKVRDSFTVL
jgi:hypothetical protein